MLSQEIVNGKMQYTKKPIVIKISIGHYEKYFMYRNDLSCYYMYNIRLVFKYFLIKYICEALSCKSIRVKINSDDDVVECIDFDNQISISLLNLKIENKHNKNPFNPDSLLQFSVTKSKELNSDIYMKFNIYDDIITFDESIKKYFVINNPLFNYIMQGFKYFFMRVIDLFDDLSVSYINCTGYDLCFNENHISKERNVEKLYHIISAAKHSDKCYSVDVLDKEFNAESYNPNLNQVCYIMSENQARYFYPSSRIVVPQINVGCKTMPLALSTIDIFFEFKVDNFALNIENNNRDNRKSRSN